MFGMSPVGGSAAFGCELVSACSADTCDATAVCHTEADGQHRSVPRKPSCVLGLLEGRSGHVAASLNQQFAVNVLRCHQLTPPPSQGVCVRRARLVTDTVATAT